MSAGAGVGRGSGPGDDRLDAARRGRRGGGAQTRGRQPCRRPVGWGTDHPGDGRCKLHGGASPRGADHPAFRHGRYSKYLGAEEQVEFEEFRSSLGAQADFEEELLVGLFRGYRQIAQGAKIPAMLDGEVVLVDPDPKYILTCPDCGAPVIVGERNSQGWWRCRRCRQRQRSPALIPVRDDSVWKPSPTGGCSDGRLLLRGRERLV